MEWFYNGFFGIAEPYGNNLDTVKQFLEYSDIPVVNTAPAYNYKPVPSTVGVNVYDIANERFNTVLSFDEFVSTEIDAIICSIPCHIDKFIRLRNEYKPNAKLIFQIGNPAWNVPDQYPNVLDSVGVTSGENLNYIKYHQPFDEQVFYPASYVPQKLVSSFVLFPDDMPLFTMTSELLKDYTFDAYGHLLGCNKNPITGITNIASLMHDSKFGWHNKQYDGYGHIIHNWFAAGRPVLCYYPGYAGRQAGDLLIHEVTGFNLYGTTPQEIAAFIRKCDADPNFYKQLCDSVREVYNKYVNFDDELVKLRVFFERLR
jgi:hypothetical protein